jgi:hypothetical protein
MRPRDTQTWVICEDTGDQAVKGECPHHGGDACLIVVQWKGRKASVVPLGRDLDYRPLARDHA